MIVKGQVEKKIPLLVIAGPTASGKTSLATSLAARLNAELIGADSMQVYKHMNIGTDTPSQVELGPIKHHLINIVAPDESYDAARFKTDADGVIQSLADRGKRALLVGGTGLYIRILLKGLQAGPPPNPMLRKEITKEAETLGWPQLHKKLEKLDPMTAAKLHPNDGVRILRALEVVRLSDKPISQWQAEHAFQQNRYPFLFLLTDRPKEDLNLRINARVDQMIEQGFLDEVKGLLDMGYSPTLKPMQALGYKHLCEHLEGGLSLDLAIEKTKTDTRRFAKRQRNWFRSEDEAQMISPDLDKSYERAAEFFEQQEVIKE